MRYKVFKAPELRIPDWIDVDGEKTTALRLADFKGKYKVIYCFQHWCPGCHSVGFPSLQKLVNAFKDRDKIQFLAVQTVFEGRDKNTHEKIVKTQAKYGLSIPFGHDAVESRSTIMQNYRIGGTPWFIFIDEVDNVFFADFHINTDETIKYLKKVLI